MKDDEIIPLLLQLRRPTFFSLDSDFYNRRLCHLSYCLVFVDVDQYEAATFTRRLLRHYEFRTHAKRMGTIIRLSHIGLSVWRLHFQEEIHFDWRD